MMPDIFKHGPGAYGADLSKLVGNTPLIALRYRYRGGEVQELLVKCEQYNLTQSIKDRVILYTLERARSEGKLRAGDQIIDACCGHSGISLAAIGRALGHPVKIVMPDHTGMELRAAIRAYGAELQLACLESYIKIAEAMAFHDGVFVPRRLAAACQVETHERTTGREIGHYLLLERIKPAAVVAGIGTGSTLLGIGKYLTAMYPDVTLHPVWAAAGEAHRISGFCEDTQSVPGICKWIGINGGDAVLMAKKLGGSAGLPVGISSGANFLGAVKVQQELGSDKVVITVFPDGSKYYPALSDTEAVKEGYMSPDIELMGYKVLDKV